MLSVVLPDADQIQKWLRQAGIQHYICEHCHGLHISELQGRDGVVDSRLFVEEDALLLTTELEVRPSALFMLMGDTPRLNMTYPALKVFLDVNDDSLPRLVACDTLFGRSGVTFEQFIYFVQATVDATVQLLDECLAAGCLIWPDEGEEPALPGNAGSLH